MIMTWNLLTGMQTRARRVTADTCAKIMALDAASNGPTIDPMDFQLMEDDATAGVTNYVDNLNEAEKEMLRKDKGMNDEQIEAVVDLLSKKYNIGLANYLARDFEDCAQDDGETVS